MGILLGALAAALALAVSDEGQTSPPPQSGQQRVVEGNGRAPDPYVDPQVPETGEPIRAIPETSLRVVPSGTESHVSEVVPPRAPWSFPRRHLKEGKVFADPFQGVELWPELSLGTQVQLEGVRPNQQMDFSQRVDLNLYLLEVKFPNSSAVNGRTSGLERVDLDFKWPFGVTSGGVHHRFAPFGGAGRKVGAAADHGEPDDFRYGFIYGLAVGGFAAQLRPGYSFTAVPGGGPGQRVSAFTYGGVFSYLAGENLHLVAEIEGQHRTGGGRFNQLFVLPGVYYYPTGEATLQLGAAMVVDLADDASGTFREHGLGGVLQISYNFL